MLRTKKADKVRISVPKEGFVFPIHYFLPVLDKNNEYLGTSEWRIDVWPFIQYYLKTTGLNLIQNTDVTSSASEHEAANRAEKMKNSIKTDTNTSASQHK